MEFWQIVVTSVVVFQITSAWKCSTGCFCDSIEFGISLKCISEPYYVTNIPKMPQNTTYLEIRLCHIQSLTDNVFYINGGENLYQIEFNENRLQSISQNAFNGLKELRNLNIADSFLHSLIGTEFSHLYNIKILTIPKSNLQEIPLQSLCHMKHIQTIILSKNEIQQLKLDECFEQFEAFYHLDVSNNPLHNLLHTAFLPLKDIRLRDLILNDCKLQDLEDNIFVYVKHLRVLNLINNKLKRLPKLPAGLHTLQVSGNNLKVIDDKVYGKLHFLTDLNMNEINISSAKFGDNFKNASKLSSITLQHNKLNQLFKTDFINLEFAHIETLSIDECQLKSIEAGTFQKLHHLKYLSISGNRLTAKALEIGLTMTPWENLMKLSLQSNPVTEINQQTFRGITQSQLREINIASIKIQGMLPNGVFQNLVYLQRISMDGAEIKGLGKQVLINSSKVKELSMSKNQLTTFPRYLDTPLLEYLSLSWNKGITTIAQADLKWYSNLIILDLSHCSLSTIGKKAFMFNRKLEKLMLHANSLTMPLTPAILSNLENLENLQLSENNDIGSFDVEAFSPIPNIIDLELNTLHCLGRNATKLSESLKTLTHLQKLVLSSTQLDTIPIAMFQNMKNLTVLALSNNWISHWEPEVFRSQKHLKTLMLSTNKITYVDRRAFWYLPSLHTIDLSNNPFTCTCDLLSFRIWMDADSGVILQRMDKKSNYKCLTPPEMRGTFLLDYSITEQSCMSYTLFIILLAVMITYFTTVTGVAMLYRYWWYIR